MNSINIDTLNFNLEILPLKEKIYILKVLKNRFNWFLPINRISLKGLCLKYNSYPKNLLQTIDNLIEKQRINSYE